MFGFFSSSSAKTKNPGDFTDGDRHLITSSSVQIVKATNMEAWCKKKLPPSCLPYISDLVDQVQGSSVALTHVLTVPSLGNREVEEFALRSIRHSTDSWKLTISHHKNVLGLQEGFPIDQTVQMRSCVGDVNVRLPRADAEEESQDSMDEGIGPAGRVATESQACGASRGIVPGREPKGEFVYDQGLCEFLVRKLPTVCHDRLGGVVQQVKAHKFVGVKRTFPIDTRNKQNDVYHIDIERTTAKACFVHVFLTGDTHQVNSVGVVTVRESKLGLWLSRRLPSACHDLIPQMINQVESSKALQLRHEITLPSLDDRAVRLFSLKSICQPHTTGSERLWTLELTEEIDILRDGSEPQVASTTLRFFGFLDGAEPRQLGW